VLVEPGFTPLISEDHRDQEVWSGCASLVYVENMSLASQGNPSHEVDFLSPDFPKCRVKWPTGHVREIFIVMLQRWTLAAALYVIYSKGTFLNDSAGRMQRCHPFVHPWSPETVDENPNEACALLGSADPCSPAARGIHA